MKRILLTYDGSDGAISAIEELKHAGLPEVCEARVIAVSDAWAPPAALDSEPELPEFMRETRVHARERAAEALKVAERIASDGAALVRQLFPAWQIDFVGRADSPSWAILEEARRWKASIVAAGAQSHSTLQRFFLGSVSQKIVSDAQCSVRVSRQRRDLSANVRVLIAFDGSPDSRAAAAEAVNRNWPAGTQVRLITIRQDELAVLAPRPEVTTVGNPPPADWLEQALAEITERFIKKGVEAEYHILEGGIRRKLLHLADDWAADVIFVGACGWRHQGRWRVGSVPTALAQRAPCTVEIVRPLSATHETGSQPKSSPGNPQQSPGVRS